MYTFIVKDSRPGLDIIITRAMLALAAFAAIFYHGDTYFYVSIISALVLLLTAIFIRQVLVKLKMNKFVLLFIAAVILLIATHAVMFAVILLGYGIVINFFYHEPVIEITGKNVTIKRLITSPTYQWNEFSNIILKDGLLTLDFKNNQLIQVAIDDAKMAVDENDFNNYCRGFIEEA